MKRYSPEPGAALTAMAARLDILERRLGSLEDLRTDVTTLGGHVAELTGQLRRLNTAGDRPAGQTPAATDAAPPDLSGGAATGHDQDQPNWITVTDRQVAIALLTNIDDWGRTVLGPLGAMPGPPCWPLHPPVVVELLALAAEHDAAYQGKKPTGVSEWLARWLPSARSRIAAELDPCHQEQAHRHRGRTYEVRRLDLGYVAAWWADTHGENPDAVEAFALSPAL